jgi:hypothetical protein
MTLEEAKSKLIAAGYQGEPTVAALRQAGWTPVDPLEGVTLSGPALSEADLKDHLAKLVEEARDNNTSAQIIQAIVTFGSLAMKSLL